MNHIKTFKLFEKSSLTTLGVSEEVMKEIQINFEIDSDSTWTKMQLKKDIISDLKSDTKSFYISLKKDNIFIFINNHKNYIKQYFKYETDGWGSYRIDEREDITLTQLGYSIDMKDEIYKLDNSNFEIETKQVRKLDAQTEKLDKTTEDFKMYILTNFNSILRKIYGRRHKKVMSQIADNIGKVKSDLNTDELLKFLDDNKKLADTAKEYETAKENNDILKINQLEKQYNSLTILDEYLIKFETEYSDKFNYHLNIHDLIKTFGQMPIETAFMYYLYTGKIKSLEIKESSHYFNTDFEIGDYIVCDYTRGPSDSKKWSNGKIGKIIKISQNYILEFCVHYDNMPRFLSLDGIINWYSPNVIFHGKTRDEIEVKIKAKDFNL